MGFSNPLDRCSCSSIFSYGFKSQVGILVMACSGSTVINWCLWICMKNFSKSEVTDTKSWMANLFESRAMWWMATQVGNSPFIRLLFILTYLCCKKNHVSARTCVVSETVESYQRTRSINAEVTWHHKHRKNVFICICCEQMIARFFPSVWISFLLFPINFISTEIGLHDAFLWAAFG